MPCVIPSVGTWHKARLDILGHSADVGVGVLVLLQVVAFMVVLVVERMVCKGV